MIRLRCESEHALACYRERVNRALHGHTVADHDLPLLSTTAESKARATTPNPDCEVCGGTGTDPVFYGDCSECWPDHERTSVARYLARAREERYEASRQQGILNRTA
jgi:2-phospho-L-lactate guanylyltransferase (CobY/MobA/RfbA family)